jgi:D-glycero-alpha-D-manno-heptose-7-phosphate kinase
MSRRVVSGMCLENYNCAVHITASAPTRIDLAGGTIDIWPLYLFHPGAQTLNAAISLRAHVRLEHRTDDRVALVSEDTARQVLLPPGDELRTDPTLPLLGRLAHHFGVRGLTMTTRGESPAGAGIAGSSALNIAVCGALNEWAGTSYGPETLLEIAKDIEAQVINVPTGLQDYRPALYGGIAAVELAPGAVKRLGLDVDAAELEKRLVLCYTGEPRNSGTNNWEITKRHIDGDRHVFDCFERIRDTAVSMRRALVAGQWDDVATHLATEWDNRKRLAPGVSTPAIDALIARAQAAGAQAVKVCGAGGGGCLVAMAPPTRTVDVRQALAAGGARLLDFSIESNGLRLG